MRSSLFVVLLVAGGCEPVCTRHSDCPEGLFCGPQAKCIIPPPPDLSTGDGQAVDQASADVTFVDLALDQAVDMAGGELGSDLGVDGAGEDLASDLGGADAGDGSTVDGGVDGGQDATSDAITVDGGIG